MLLDQKHHYEGHGAGGGGDHAGAPACKGNDYADAERGVEPDLGVHPRDDGKRDSLGNERQRNDDAREQIAPDIGKPGLLDRCKIHRHRKRHQRMLMRSRRKKSEKAAPPKPGARLSGEKERRGGNPLKRGLKR